MDKIHGINTRAIGQELKLKFDADKLKYEQFKIYYDHGDSRKVEVCQPTAYMGRRYGSDATLSAVDIVITKGKEVVIAIEIEESTTRPKTVLGDIFGIALADKLRINNKPYSLNDVIIIVAIASDGKGKLEEKYKRMERHLGRYFEASPSSNVNKIRIITCATTDMVRRIERLIRLETSKHH